MADTTVPERRQRTESALSYGPRKKAYALSYQRFAISQIRRTTTDPFVHHGRHFGRVIHTFCNVNVLITNGLVSLGDASGSPEPIQ